uniref:Protein kinase domain-containing protein n=1 Tax=Attheya septentrionalis TaxID=420275 RepID=A0A7S2XRW8_9STRA|mmetsp:Transcript_3252/g.5924  ORF Transcript_3252/g.5924 Transcript_3252/m.5924 type:complete len:629 (+) Transcript_3252:87-1973(+)
MAKTRTKGGDLPAGKRRRTSIRLKMAPPAVGAHISASKSPKTREQHAAIAIVNITHVYNDELFFDAAAAAASTVTTVSPMVIKSIKNTRLGETGLRDAVYTELLRQKITFPKSAHSKGRGVTKRKNFKKSKVYSETNLSSLLAEFETTYWKNGQTAGGMERLMQGLPVTTSSKPDATVIVESDSDTPDTNGKKNMELIFGEFKNNIKYSITDSVNQCALYLYALLFWLRSRRGLKVEAVYGFTFCGRKCEGHGQGTYSVSLIKISPPQKLNEQLKVEVFMKQGGLDDHTPLLLLVNFLKHGKRWEHACDVPGADPIPNERCISALFTLPTALWTDTGDRQLVLNGTMSIVFRVTKAGLEDLFANHFNEFEDKRGGAAMQLMVQELENNNDMYYVKIRSTDTCMIKHPLQDMKGAEDVILEDDDLRFTYCLPVYGDASCCIIIMRNRGDMSHLKKNAFESLDSLRSAFRGIMGTALRLCPRLTHCDVLPHNFVFESNHNHLHLVDIDEGVSEMELVYQRELVYDGEDDWLTAISYPNAVREDKERYTKVQLMASFLILALLNHAEVGAVAELRVEAEKVGELLHRMDIGRKPFPFVKQMGVMVMIDSLYDKLNALVGYENESNAESLSL